MDHFSKNKSFTFCTVFWWTFVLVCINIHKTLNITLPSLCTTYFSHNLNPQKLIILTGPSIQMNDERRLDMKNLLFHQHNIYIYIYSRLTRGLIVSTQIIIGVFTNRYLTVDHAKLLLWWSYVHLMMAAHRMTGFIVMMLLYQSLFNFLQMLWIFLTSIYTFIKDSPCSVFCIKIWMGNFDWFR